VLTSSHAWWMWRFARDRPGAGWLVAGAAAPDFPALVRAGALSARGVGRAELIAATYQPPRWRVVHRTFHSVLAPLALARAGRRFPLLRPLAAGWVAHLAADLVSHHSDAWPLLWPVSDARWRSPVSYWEPDHHARAWSAVETVALAGMAARERNRTARALGLAAALLAAGPVAAGGRSMWRAVGTHPEGAPA
jgi:hypothetical protein